MAILAIVSVLLSTLPFLGIFIVIYCHPHFTVDVTSHNYNLRTWYLEAGGL
jgi:hypothetical protein